MSASVYTGDKINLLVQKTVYYDNAILKYMMFQFFIFQAVPSDPTVKRRSDLIPYLTDPKN